MMLRDAAKAVKSLRKLLASEHQLRSQLAQQGVTEENRTVLQRNLAAVKGRVVTAVATYNAWAWTLEGQPLEAGLLWDQPEAATEALLADMRKMVVMKRLIDRVTIRLEPPLIPAFGGGLQLLRGTLAVVVVALNGWLEVLFYSCGFAAYTFYMRQELAKLSLWMTLLLATTCIGLTLLFARWGPLPTGVLALAIAGAAGTAFAAAWFSLNAAAQLMGKDDLPQREKDIAELNASRATALQIAAAHASLASLARAMASRLQDTELHAEDALDAISKQQERLRALRAMCYGGSTAGASAQGPQQQPAAVQLAEEQPAAVQLAEEQPAGEQAAEVQPAAEEV